MYIHIHIFTQVYICICICIYINSMFIVHTPHMAVETHLKLSFFAAACYILLHRVAAKPVSRTFSTNCRAFFNGK